MLSTNLQANSPVKLDLRLIEADQVATPSALMAAGRESRGEGVAFDAWGNPIECHVLKSHPGSQANPSLRYTDAGEANRPYEQGPPSPRYARDGLGARARGFAGRSEIL